MYTPTKARGVDLRAVHISVTENMMFARESIPVGRDIVVLAGFFDGETPNLGILPMLSVDHVIRSVVGDLSDLEAVKAFKKTSIYQAMISCAINGGSDIVLFKLGSLSDLDANLSIDDRMQYIYDSLEAGLPYATDNEWFGYIVPVDAQAEGYTKSDGTHLNFLQLTSFACATALNSGILLQAMLSTASTNGTVLMNSESMRGKEAWQVSNCHGQQVGWVPGNDAYRFVAVPTGRALFSSQDHGLSFEHGLAPAVAGLATSLPDDVSVAGRKLNVFELRPVLGSTSDELSVAGFIPVGLSASMRRGRENGALVLGDNTMSIPYSDFKQEVVLRLARRVALKIRLALEPLIGTNGMSVGTKVQETMDLLVQAGTIRGYKHTVNRDTTDNSRVRVAIEVAPYLPVKAIEINLVTGPFVL